MGKETKVDEAGLRPVPRQGLTPPLHPRKGFHPLTRFRRLCRRGDFVPFRLQVERGTRNMLLTLPRPLARRKKLQGKKVSNMRAGTHPQ